jgi:hypothetical protein
MTKRTDKFSRRTAIKAALAAGAMGLSGCKPTAVAPIEVDPEYVSVNEAAEIYSDLYKKIKAAFESTKPDRFLKIFVGEAHKGRESYTSTAYEYMIMDIASKLKIKRLQLEAADDSLAIVEGAYKRGLIPNDMAPPFQMSDASMIRVFPQFKEAGFDIRPMDNGLTQEESIKKKDQYIEETASQRLKEKFKLTSLPKVSCKTSSKSAEYSTKIESPYIPGVSDRDKDSVISGVQLESLAYMARLREPKMIQNIDSANHEMIISGAAHSKNLSTTIAQNKKYEVFVVNAIPSWAKDVNPYRIEEDKWIKDPKNAQKPTEKPFSPAVNMKAFLEQAIALSQKNRAFAI